MLGFAAEEWRSAMHALEPRPPEAAVDEFLGQYFGAHNVELPGLSLSRPLLRALAETCREGPSRVEALLDRLPHDLREQLADPAGRE